MVKMSGLLSVNMISSNTLKEAIICVVTDNKTIERQFNYVIEKILPASMHWYGIWFLIGSIWVPNENMSLI